MAYTGYKIIQYIDDNPNSSGYGQVWTERVLDIENCPTDADNWTLVSSECEMDTSGYTGNRIDTYYNSGTSEYSSTTYADASCTASTEEENWIDSGDTYCELDEDGNYTGWGIQLQYQANANLLNYGETREVRVPDETCSAFTEPDWEEVSRQCHIAADDKCRLYFDGTADVVEIDVNPSSETFNQTRTINELSEDCICVACDEIVDEWRYVDDYCGNSVPEAYQLSGLTDDTIYHVYRKYENCIIDGQTARTIQTLEYSAVTYQTNVEDCLYRWVDTDETICVESAYTCNISNKFEITYNGTTTIGSGDTSAITSGETNTIRMSGTSNSISILIGDTVNTIGQYAFRIYNFDVYDEFRVGVDICIPDSVTTIEQNAFLTNFKPLPSLCAIDINIGTGVTSIGNEAFSDNNSDNNIVWLRLRATTPPTIGNNIFGRASIAYIKVPAESVDIYKSAPGWSEFASQITSL